MRTFNNVSAFLAVILALAVSSSTSLFANANSDPMPKFDGGVHLKRNQVVLVCNDPRAPGPKKNACYRNEHGNFYVDCDLQNEAIKLFNCSSHMCEAGCTLVQTIRKDAPSESRLLEFADKPDGDKNDPNQRQGLPESEGGAGANNNNRIEYDYVNLFDGASRRLEQPKPRFLTKFNFTGKFFNYSGNHSSLITRLDYRKVNGTITPGAIDNCSRRALGAINFIPSDRHICIPPRPSRRSLPPASSPPCELNATCTTSTTVSTTTTAPPTTTSAASGSDDDDNDDKDEGPKFWTHVVCLADGDVRVESYDENDCRMSSLKHNVTFRNGTCINATRGPANLTRFECRHLAADAHTVVAVVNVEFPPAPQSPARNSANSLSPFAVLATTTLSTMMMMILTSIGF